jgi:AraC family transcriptional regulator
MTKALGIVQGSFGRVALLDMDASLVGHAHHHCHILLKVAGPDRSFVVGDEVLPMRDDTAILVNAWERHQYEHPASAGPTIFLALYVEPGWIAQLERSFAPLGRAGLFHEPCASIGSDVRELTERLAQCLEFESHASPAEVKQLISEIVLSIMHRHAERPGPFGVANRPRLQDYRVRRALRIMRDQPAIPPELRCPRALGRTLTPAI